MADDSAKPFMLFGFEIIRKSKKKEEQEENVSFATPQTDDGAITVTVGGVSHSGTYLDLDGLARNETELITRYRQMSMEAELEKAINQVVNEAIVSIEESSVKINLNNVKMPAKVKKSIEEEFDKVLKLLEFRKLGQDLFRRWYIDGRIHFHAIIDTENPKDGLQELRYIDPRRIRKIREVLKEKDKRTGVDVIKKIQEYYLYNEFGLSNVFNATTNMATRIAVDSIITASSGLMDEKRIIGMSYLSKAIKPLNQLRMIEDSLVIYRMVHGPERRVFYINVGNMPTAKVEQYMKNIITEYRNKLVYDATTGEIRNDRKFMSMIEDIWIPRTEGSTATEIDTLQGGENLGNIEDAQYFKRKLYESLDIPISRIESDTPFNIGRSTEISRDEINFNKFIDKLRNRFSTVFDEALRLQLILKGICTEDDWKEIKEDIKYDFMKDNNFEELKEAELNMNRIQILTMVDPFVGKYYSKEWVNKNILHLDDQEIEDMQDQMDRDNVNQDLMGGQEQDGQQDQQGQDGQQDQGFLGQNPGFGGGDAAPEPLAPKSDDKPKDKPKPKPTEKKTTLKKVKSYASKGD